MNIAKPNHAKRAIDILEDALFQIVILEQRAQSTDAEMAKTLLDMREQLNDLITNFAENQEIPL